MLLTITSPNNHLRIDDIRERHIDGTNNPSLDVSEDPIIVYQGFSIHGNEPSGSNASLAVAYYLAASLHITAGPRQPEYCRAAGDACAPPMAAVARRGH